MSLDGPVYFDTCSLSNFAAVDRLDLVRTRYGRRVRWTETVRFEISRGLPRYDYLRRVLDAGWLGEPVEITPAPDALREIDLIRRGLGGRPAEPTRHLGEAELIWHLETAARGAVLVSDDRPAAAFARQRGLPVLDSAAVLAECYAHGEVGCPEAYDVLVDMRQNGRGVLVPADHREVC